MTPKQKNTIGLIIIVVCLAGAGLGYYFMSGGPTNPAPAPIQARSEVISKSMAGDQPPGAAQSKTTPPSTAPRGAIPAPPK